MLLRFILGISIYLLSSCVARQMSPEDLREEKKSYILISVNEEKDMNIFSFLSNIFSVISSVKIENISTNESFFANASSSKIQVYEIAPGKYRVNGVSSKFYGFKRTVFLIKPDLIFEAEENNIYYLGEFDISVYTNWGHYMKWDNFSYPIKTAKNNLIHNFPLLKSLEFQEIDLTNFQKNNIEVQHLEY